MNKKGDICVEGERDLTLSNEEMSLRAGTSEVHLCWQWEERWCELQILKTSGMPDAGGRMRLFLIFLFSEKDAVISYRIVNDLEKM